MGSLRPWSVLGRALRIWLRNFVPFSLLSAVVYSPIVVLTVVLARDDGLATKGWGIWSNVNAWVGPALSLVAAGPMTYGVVRHLQGERASISACISVGLSRIFPVLGVGMLSGLYVLLAGVVAGLAVMFPVGMIAFTVGLSPKSHGFLVIMAVAGTAVGLAVLLVVAMLLLAVPVAVVERPGVAKSIARSRRLTKGNVWRAFLVVVVPGVLEIRTVWAAQGGFLPDLESADDLRRQMVVTLVSTVRLFGPFKAVAASVVYHDLRVAKEGVSVEELAQVFD